MATEKEDVQGQADRAPALDLPREMVKPAILLLLQERRAHGYGLLAQLEDLGFPVTDTGGVYRVLRDLEESKMVRSKWEPATAGPARRVYQITPRGQQELTSWGQAVSRYHDLVGNYLRRLNGPKRGGGRSQGSSKAS
jgi:poly-beta-hydroxybutyrate-responsive repressor